MVLSKYEQSTTMTNVLYNTRKLFSISHTLDAEFLKSNVIYCVSKITFDSFYLSLVILSNILKHINSAKRDNKNKLQSI